MSEDQGNKDNQDANWHLRALKYSGNFSYTVDSETTLLTVRQVVDIARLFRLQRYTPLCHL